MHTTAVAQSGTVDRAGVRIAYEVTGHGDHTLVLLPAWMITNRRMWAAQVAALSGRFRVITFDSRGTGASDRPVDPAAYGVADLVADAVAVRDGHRPRGAGRQRPGGLVGFLLAARLPDRVAALVLIGASVDLAGGPPSALQRAIAQFEEQPATADGWSRYRNAANAPPFRGRRPALGGRSTPELCLEPGGSCAPSTEAPCSAVRLGPRL